MTTATATDPEVSTDLGAIYRKHAPDWTAIAEAIADAAMEDRALALQLANIGARQLCQRYVSSHRNGIVNRDPSSESDLSKRGLLVGMAMAWYDYPIADGITLGDAKRIDLSAAVARRKSEAQAKERCADWLSKIAAKLPDNSTPVRRVLKEKDIERMAESAGVKL
jgi:hypothetical protein